MNIYAGNLSRGTTEEALREAFEAFGQVSAVNIIKDRYSGESRGFGFVEMPTKSEAEAAISSLNSTELNGKTIIVNEARADSDKRRGGGSRGGFKGRGGGGGGGYGGGGGRGGGRRSW